MEQQETLESAAEALKAAIRSATHGLIERDWLVELICLAAVADEHLLVIGPAGTAKSEAVRRVAHALGGSYFEYLLGRFTEPSELFGPVDLRKLREGVVETVTSGMLPEAQIAFLDELFLGSTAVLNTLLGVLNERVFRRGHTVKPCQLRVCVAASNALPQDESLAALADRFLLRAFVHPVADAQLEELLEAGFARRAQSEPERASFRQVDVLAAAARSVDLAEVRPALAQALRTLRNAGVPLSDRRAVRAQRLIAAAAVLRGSASADVRDLWPLLYTVPTEADQLSARELLAELSSRAANTTLPSAAERASFSRAALAERLLRDGEELLRALAEAKSEDERRGFKLRVQALGREMDAGLSPAQQSESLQQLRSRFAEALS